MRIEYKLDNFLNLLNKDGLFVGIDVFKLAPHVRLKNFPNLNLTDEEYCIVRDLLLSEQLIKEENPKIYITSKGVLKIMNGGYKKDLERENNEIKTRKLLNIAQVFVIISGIYYLIEIFKSLFSFPFFFHIHGGVKIVFHFIGDFFLKGKRTVFPTFKPLFSFMVIFEHPRI